MNEFTLKRLHSELSGDSMFGSRIHNYENTRHYMWTIIPSMHEINSLMTEMLTTFVFI